MVAFENGQFMLLVETNNQDGAGAAVGLHLVTERLDDRHIEGRASRELPAPNASDEVHQRDGFSVGHLAPVASWQDAELRKVAAIELDDPPLGVSRKLPPFLRMAPVE